MVEIVIVNTKKSWRKNKCKVGICGHFGGQRTFIDGQTIKTKSITNELLTIFGENNVVVADTYGGIKSLPKCLLALFMMLRYCENIIILPAHNSVKVFPAFLTAFNRLFKKKIHYIVIGGWLPFLVQNNSRLAKILKRLDYIYVETSTMKKQLELLEFSNVVLMYNFKKLRITDLNTIGSIYEHPFRLCVFSRIMEKKGIEDIINVIKEINIEQREIIYSLDIYGPIDSEYVKRFSEIREVFPDYVKYLGVVDSLESVEVLKDYFALVFPTLFYTEGIPGTIIDAYAAGLPVISSKWESFNDLIIENQTGIGYSFGDTKDLKKQLLKIMINPDEFISMKRNCILKARDYMPDVALKPLVERL